MESSWWQRLEQELEQQFDRFLSDHPNQKELLDQEHWNEQQRRKHQRLLGIDQEAQDLRHAPLGARRPVCQIKSRLVDVRVVPPAARAPVPRAGVEDRPGLVPGRLFPHRGEG